MKCKIDGCNRDSVYLKQRVCQKHYFRFMRYGKYDLTMKPRKYRIIHSSGYHMIYEPKHPLAQSNGYVYEHRKIIFEKYGHELPNCQLCGKATSWKPYFTHIDHINKDPSDNREGNLRVLCNACNSQRDVDVLQRKNVTTINYNGESKSAFQWAKHPDAQRCGSAILRKIRNGCTPYEAIFSANKTHPK